MNHRTDAGMAMPSRGLLWRVLSLVAAMAAMCLAQDGQDIAVEAVGYGPNLDAAVRAAQRAAVEKGIGQVIQSQTELENFRVKRDLVLTRTVGAVKSFEIKRKEQGPDGAWEVAVAAVVSKAQIREDLLALAVLRSAVGNPRVAVLVRETLVGTPRPDGAVEHQITQSFLSREFKVMQASGALRTQRARDLALALDGDPKVAASIGQELGAEVVVIGSATGTESDLAKNPMFGKSGMRSASGTIVLKAYDVQTREILTTVTTDEASIHVNPEVAASTALEKAARKAMEAAGTGLVDQLLKVWQHKANNGTTLNVVVRNVPNFASSQIVEEELRTQAVSAETTRFAEKVLSMDVVWRGTATDFCAALDGRKINKDRNTLNVVSREGNSIVLEVK